MELMLASRNSHKAREFRELLGAAFDTVDLTNFPEIAPPEEIGRTFAENATLKAVAVSKKLPGLVIADDSGLEVDVLGSAPGIYSARYAGENASDTANIEKLLGELRARKTTLQERTARFRCVIALASEGEVLGIFEGVVEGVIVDPSRGNNGFGYDPVFQPIGLAQTFAEMNADLKNKISHRAKAVAALLNALVDQD